MSTEVPPGQFETRMTEKLRRLQEYGSSISRLAIPATHRDALGLEDGQPVAFNVFCRDGQPAVRIDVEAPQNDDSPDARTVQIGKQGQATVTFPRSLAAAIGFRETLLCLRVEDSALVVERDASTRNDRCD